MAHPPQALKQRSHKAAERLKLVRRVRQAREDKREHQTLSAIHEAFHRFAHGVSRAVGSPLAFVGALVIVAGWALSGPIFGYSDTWQLVINTGTTIITFLVVFAIQNTQNRDSQALHLKLDELIRAIEAARNDMVEIENLPDAELARLEDEMRDLCSKASDDHAGDKQQRPAS